MTDQNAAGEAPANRQVNIIKFDALTREKTVVASCRLIDSGLAEIECDNEHLMDRLKTGVYSSALDRAVRPEDGNDYLDALLTEFRSIYMFAEEPAE